MGRKKLIRFKEFPKLPHAFEFPPRMKGKWNKIFFKNDNPLILEIGCGTGEHTLGLAEKYPEKNIIGIDIQGERLWFGAKKAQTKNVPNVAFLRAYVEQLDEYFSKNEISEIWITFPDPYPKQRQAKKRLTSERFLKLYKKIMINEGVLNLKTDSKELCKFSIVSILKFGGKIDLFDDDVDPERERMYSDLKIQTSYEKKFREQGKQIFYLQSHLFHA